MSELQGEHAAATTRASSTSCPRPGGAARPAVMTTLFPSVILQQQVNSVSTRHIQPSGHGAFDFVWTHFGFEDDDDGDDAAPPAPGQPVRPGRFRLGRRRRGDRAVARRAFEARSRSTARSSSSAAASVGDTEHMVTETLIRGMYAYWQQAASMAVAERTGCSA